MIAALLMAAGMVAAAAPDDPLAPARGGALQCFMPDTVRKTCYSLTEFIFDADGTIRNHGRGQVWHDPLVVMSMSSTVTVHDGLVCGPIVKAEHDAATFTIDGQPAGAKETAELRALVWQPLEGLEGKKLCARFFEDGTITEDFVEGGAIKPDRGTTIWVMPSEGYVIDYIRP